MLNKFCPVPFWKVNPVRASSSTLMVGPESVTITSSADPSVGGSILASRVRKGSEELRLRVCGQKAPKLGQGQRGGHDAPWVLSAMTPQLTSSSDSMGSLFPAPRFEHLQVPPQSPKETFKGTLSFPLMLSSGTVISRPNGDKENQSPRKPSMVSAPGFCPA